MSLESKRYVASAADIRELATEMFSAVNAGRQSRATYLRALIGTTQARLKDKTAPEDQRRMLKSVQEEFKIYVLEVVDKEIADVPKRQQAHERNRRMNFARTAYATVRGWLRVDGHDIHSIPVAKITKNELAGQAAPRNPHKPTPERTQAKITKYVQGLLTAIRPYAIEDSAGAREVLEEAIRMLTAEARSLKPGREPSSPMVTTMTSRRNAKQAAVSRQRTISKKAA